MTLPLPQVQAQLSTQTEYLFGLMEGMSELVAILDAEFRYVAFNSAYQREFTDLFGEEISVGMSLRQALSGCPDEWTRVQELARCALRAESFRIVEEFGPASRKRHYEIAFSPVRDSQGKLIGTAHVARDVSEPIGMQNELLRLNAELEERVEARTRELRVANWALTASEQRFRLALNNYPSPFIIYGSKRHVAWCNDAALAAFRRPLEEVIGKRDEDLLPENVSNAYAPLLRAAMESRQRTSGEVQVELEGGERRWMIATYVPLLDRAGSVRQVLGIHQDITERKRFEEELRASEDRLQLAMKAAKIGMWERDAETGAGIWSAQTKAILGVEADRYTLDEFLARVHPADLPKLRQQLSEGFRTAEPFECEYRIVRPNGEVRWVNDRGQDVRDADGRRHMIGAAVDITERRQTEERLRLAAKALESTAEGVMITRRGRVVSANKAFTTITGYALDEVMDQHVSLLHGDRYDSDEAEARRVQVERTGFWQGELWGRRKNGEIFPAWVSLSLVEDEINGRHYVSVFSDISANKAAEARLEYLAHHDVLTGLPNRFLLNDRLREALLRANRNGALVAIMYLDLDHFKPVNDTLGHEAGDQLLQAVAQRLSGCVRKTDTVARLGGDEFMVLLDELREADEAAWVAQNVLNVLGKPFGLAGRQVYISASIGIACHPMDGKSPDVLLRHADVAMYKAKEEGKNGYRFFSRNMSRHAREKLFLSNSLRTALDGNELRVDYQPRISAAGSQVIGAEALVRWHSPEHGLILPARFIGLAEETGMIEPIGEWVLRNACEQMQRWREAGRAPKFVSVNLSPRQFSQPRLADRVAAILEETGLPAEMLEFEITESMVMGNPEKAKKTLTRLADLGVTLSLDDFGTGYSSLAHLRRFPVHQLKIDQSFVRDVPGNEDACAITRAIIALAKSLRRSVTAEGVETPAQRDFLVAEGCDAWQGYLFSAPVSAEELLHFL